MNYRKFTGICMLLFLTCTLVPAQGKIPINQPDYNKPRLFDNLPNNIPVALTELQSLFKLTPSAINGKAMNAKFTDKAMASFSGPIATAVSKYDNRLQTLIIKPTIYNGATFSLSSSTKPDGTIEYSGRIISFRNGDAFVLKKQDEKYFLIKKNIYELVNE